MVLNPLSTISFDFLAICTNPKIAPGVNYFIVKLLPFSDLPTACLSKENRSSCSEGPHEHSINKQNTGKREVLQTNLQHSIFCRFNYVIKDSIPPSY